MESLQKEFVPYNFALRMKALGFDEPCFGYYDSNGEFRTKQDEYELYLICNSKWISPSCSAPLFQQAFRWFREKYDLLGIPTHSKYTIISNKWVGQPLYGNYISYEEAELACLEKLLEIVEEKQK
jgi:hypothetical protein